MTFSSNIAIILGKAVKNTCHYSVEAGAADGKHHFDHHLEEHKNNPCPCEDTRIVKIVDHVSQIRIGITHIDADTFLALLRLLGVAISDRIDLKLVALIDENGTSVVEDKLCDTLCYMKGLQAASYEIGFPRIPQEAEEEIDVTAYIEQLVAMGADNLIEKGRNILSKEEATYKHNRISVSANGKVGLWKQDITLGEEFDPSRPYEDGVEVVVVHRIGGHVQCSVYVNPNANFAIENAPTEAGERIGNLVFNGHKKACGAPRGLEISSEQALEIYAAILDRV